MHRINWLCFVFACLFFSVLPEPTVASDLPVEMKLYYHEFNIITYGDITPENVEISPHAELWFYGNNQLINKIVNQVNKHHKMIQFDNRNVRLKLQLGQGKNTATYLVDRAGGVLRLPDNKTFQMSNSEKTSLHNQIVQLKGIVDKRPTFTFW